MSTIQNLKKSLVRNGKSFGSLVADAVSGAEFASFWLWLEARLPLPPAGDGPVCSQLALFWNCSIFLLFCKRARSVFLAGYFSLSLSLAIPQFKLLSQVSSLQLPSRHSGPVLTLSNAAHSCPFSPHLRVVDASVWGTFLLGVAFRHVTCGFYLFFLLVRLPSEIQNLPPDPPVRGFPVVWKLPLLSLPTRDRSLFPALLPLFLYFALPPFEDNGLLFWVPDVLARDQKLFCVVYSVFKCSFDEPS